MVFLECCEWGAFPVATLCSGWTNPFGMVLEFSLTTPARGTPRWMVTLRHPSVAFRTLCR
jgi:hypothetical protein